MDMGELRGHCTQVAKLLLERGDMETPICRVLAMWSPAILLASLPQCCPVGPDDAFHERVVFRLVPFLPAMVPLAYADDEPRVCVRRAVCPRDEVVCLQDKLAVLARTIAWPATSRLSSLLQCV